MSGKRLRIAYVVHDYDRVGGQSRYVAELATRLSLEHEVHVFTNTINGHGSDRITFHRVPTWRATALTTILSFAFSSRLQCREAFDIIHLQGFCGPRGDVITAHICNQAWFSALGKLTTEVTWRERLFHLFATALERRLYGTGHNFQVIAVSKRVGQDVAEFYGCEAPIHVIHHGVDLRTFCPANRELWRLDIRSQLGLDPSETAFLYVGDLRKGARQCIRALAQLNAGILLLVSRSDSRPYQSLADRIGCGERVKFLGSTDEVEKAYAAADVLLMPTPYDAFGMVVTEAMACALPVIVSREAGAAELVHDGVNGLLLSDSTDDRELAGLMQSLWDNSALAAELGSAARKTVEAYSWDTVAQQTIRVYQKVVGCRRSRLQGIG